jgi:antitoxin (DNA-binding transcriptional repressor) of toxin-antitoxin stability system
MKQISIQGLKSQLSAAIADAESGSTILITRHNRNVAQLSPVDIQCLHVGKQFGRGKLKAALKTGTRGRYLEVLLEDRRGRDGR